MGYLPDLSFGPDTRIVLVGTTRCPLDEATLPPVPHAEKNIDYLTRLFIDPDICGLDPGCIIRVLDRENANEITEEIARAAQEATDTLLVYYVGHGLYGDADNAIYLAARRTTEAGKAYNGVPVRLVQKAMRSSRARKRILILDCCYAGRALDGLLAPANLEATLRPAIDIEGTYGISAVPANARALAPPDETFTRFTGALVDVLEHGLRTDDRVLTLEDVFAEVERKIGRKADAPLPKQINWDKGEKFCIARNRSLHGRELDRLYEAVEGLRETVTATGARLQALEAKVGGFDEWAQRVAAVEIAVNKRGASTPGQGGAREARETRIWEHLDLEESEWELLPAQPYKLHVRRCIAGRRNAMMLLTGLATAEFFLIPLHIAQTTARALSIFYMLDGLLVLCAVLLAAAVLVGRSSGLKRPEKEITQIKTLLAQNEHLAAVMDRRVTSLFGVSLDTHLTAAAALLALLPAAVAAGLHYLPSVSAAISPAS